MALIDVERAVLSICFSAEPPEAAFTMLGERDRWLLYRELTRDRLWRELHVALPRTAAALGESKLSELFVAYLDRDPPRTRYFREVVRSFASSAARAELSSCTLDLLRYEAALWEVADLEAGPLDRAPSEFAFDRVPVLTPALRLLSLAHAVHLAPDASGAYRPGVYHVGVHRSAGDAKPRTWRFNETTWQLLADFARQEVTAIESVQRVASKLGRQVTPQFVDRLCDSLAQWIEVGILLGSR